MIPKPDSAAGVQSPSLREGRVRARHPASSIIHPLFERFEMDSAKNCLLTASF
jgi:hypothetical protein